MENVVLNFMIIAGLFSLSLLFTVAYSYFYGIPEIRMYSNKIKQERLSSLKDLLAFKEIRVEGSDKMMKRLTADFHETNDRLIRGREKIIMMLTVLVSTTLILLIFSVVLLVGLLNSLLS